jgi:sulfopyruvate decarboxylase subunit alpha
MRIKQEERTVSVSEKIVSDFVKNKIEFVTTVPCKQLAGVIDNIETSDDIYHIPSNKEDEGIGLCAGAFMGGKRSAIIMQNTAIGVTINTLVTLTQYYRMPLPMLISYRGELGEPVACQVEMAVHTKALLAQLNIPTYHFHHENDVAELDAILAYTYMCNKPVAILTDATFWKGY